MTTLSLRRGASAALVAIAAISIAAGGWRLADAANVIRIGAVFPITSNAAGLAGPELAGVRIAVDIVNADGGIAGRHVELEVRDLRSRADADSVMSELRSSGVQLVIGAYASDLSIAASQAADRAGLLYWEAGAVADRLTGRGLPLVFRVGASGSNLGTNSASFAATELASRLGKAVDQLRIALAVADDDYANSVADAAESTARAKGMPVVMRRAYNLTLPDWPAVMADLQAARPDVIILASHIPDGIAFRQAMLRSGLRVGALIGSTMAECDPDFAGELGAGAIGVFASDRPTAGFRPTALRPDAAAAYARFETAWATLAAQAGGSGDVSTGDGYGAGGGRYGAGGGYGTVDSEYSIHGPAENATAEESEEALSGFTAAWTLFEQVLPRALGPGGAGALDPGSVAAAARSLDLPEGSLPNGAGLRFSTSQATLGQNERAAAVMWQWTAERTYAFVWPPAYATANVAFVPLDR
ncbi:MAG TPA: ABC transporter substrate-binding protein [Candidatus Limnocylindrales bacterium]|nr:ABC transporter substrate-binding protein [Candidatus Limnocylindrales bacterium]